MKRLYITLAAVIGMALLIPIAPYLAVSADSSLYTHFTYQFAHANILHWIVNGWALLILHNLLRPLRLIIAYLLSVIITFIPATTPPEPSGGMLGSSVITCFFFGFIAPYFWRKGERLTACMMLALIIIGFFIHGIAAWPHLLMFLSGIVWFFPERLYRSFTSFVNQK